MNKHLISPQPLTYELLERIINEPFHFELSDESKQLIQKCRDYIDRKMENHDTPIYGITTGFGSLCNHTISRDELSQLQKNLVMSHACSTGTEVQPEIVRLMLFLKAHALSLGNSGVQVETVQRILDFLNNDVLPVVYDRGSLGASGDLAPLSNLFLPLIGMGDVYYKGVKQDAAN
ncbi:MAG TPA: aromatic amino acid ammonia-lyase, partial [Tenuifilaceae bacterium]|nr:aromatic amino acid ammonia-lyase [Tenuifilaceae bacterium]